MGNCEVYLHTLTVQLMEALERARVTIHQMEGKHGFSPAREASEGKNQILRAATFAESAAKCTGKSRIKTQTHEMVKLYQGLLWAAEHWEENREKGNQYEMAKQAQTRYQQLLNYGYDVLAQIRLRAEQVDCSDGY